MRFPLRSVLYRKPTTLRVLMADDNPVVRAAVGRLFRLLGFEAVLVANGREAVELAAAEHFDVVFLDIQMPEMNGFEAASLMRRGANGSGLWIVGLSASLDEGLAETSGMDEFLVKPLRLNDLVEVLKRHQCTHSSNKLQTLKRGTRDISR